MNGTVTISVCDFEELRECQVIVDDIKEAYAKRNSCDDMKYREERVLQVIKEYL